MVSLLFKASSRTLTDILAGTGEKMMTIEQQIEEQKQKDEMHRRRLIIGCPIYADYLTHLRVAAARSMPTTLAIVPYRSGYYDHLTGTFLPVERQTPAPR